MTAPPMDVVILGVPRVFTWLRQTEYVTVRRFRMEIVRRLQNVLSQAPDFIKDGRLSSSTFESGVQVEVPYETERTPAAEQDAASNLDDAGTNNDDEYFGGDSGMEEAETKARES